MKHPGQEFYEDWASQQLSNPERDIVLEWKAIHLANLFRSNFPRIQINSVCEVGGAEGTVIASVGRLLGANNLDCYELSDEFCRIRSMRHSNVSFVNGNFEVCQSDYDIGILSDITEHVEDDDYLLKNVCTRCRYVLLKMPIEVCIAGSQWRYRLQGKLKPRNMLFGKDHYNGHLRGYTVKSALVLVERHFKIIDYYLLDPSFYYHGGKRFNWLRRWVGIKPLIWLVGGSLFVLGARN